MKTSMQELKEDLQLTIDTANEALMEIEDVVIRKACQKTVELTLKNIVKRIDDELLTMEKRQIFAAHYDGQEIEDTSGFSDADYYYNSTFGDNHEAGI